MSEKEKLESLVKNHFDIHLKEKYIINKEIIEGENITEISSVKIISLNVNMEELLAEGSTSLIASILFKVLCKRRAGRQIKFFQFSCNIEVEYIQTEKKYAITDTGIYNPIERKDAANYF